MVDDTILAKITGSKFGIPNTEVELDPAVESRAGLSKRCYAACTCLLTRDEAVLGRVVGSLSPAAMTRIDACLKAVLAIR
jgi:mRNA-degrading endonuclease toxin of MazEF toxin-antitoxin module